MRSVALALTLLLMLDGCNRQPEGSYQGKSTSEWIRLSNDSDQSTRTEAFRALAILKATDPPAKQRIEAEYEKAKTDAEKVRAGVHLWPDRGDDTFAAAKRATRATADGAGEIVLDEVEALVNVDNKRRGQLVPDLDYAIGKAGKDNTSPVIWQRLRDVRELAAKP